jgi:RNA polymerase sigma-70 factor (ECF subfamily)
MMALAMPPPEKPRYEEIDAATLDRARALEPMAVRAFVIRYERTVFALISRVLGHGAHVEDLAQETCLKAVRALPAFDPAGPARPSTWLLTIATRVALDARKKRRIPTTSLDAIEGAASPADPATPETERKRRDLGRAIERAAADLSDDMRAAFVLADIHGLTMAEIANALSIPEATAKTRVFRARKHLRERLAPLREEDSHE